MSTLSVRRPWPPLAAVACPPQPPNGVLLDDGLDVGGAGVSGAWRGFPGMYGPGFVGSNFAGQVAAAGNIYLAINDDTFNCFGDNSGGYTATITHVPAANLATTTILVPATTFPSVNTGIYVTAGSPVIITASGTSCCCNGTGCVSPIGGTTPVPPACPGTPTSFPIVNNHAALPGISFMGLIGSIGGPF